MREMKEMNKADMKGEMKEASDERREMMEV